MSADAPHTVKLVLDTSEDYMANEKSIRKNISLLIKNETKNTQSYYAHFYYATTKVSEEWGKDEVECYDIEQALLPIIKQSIIYPSVTFIVFAKNNYDERNPCYFMYKIINGKSEEFIGEIQITYRRNEHTQR